MLFEICAAGCFLQLFCASLKVVDLGWIFPSVLTGEIESSVKNWIWPNFKNLTGENLVRFDFWHWIPSSNSKYLEKVTPHIILKNNFHHIKMARALCVLFLKGWGESVACLKFHPKCSKFCTIVHLGSRREKKLKFLFL